MASVRRKPDQLDVRIKSPKAIKAFLKKIEGLLSTVAAWLKRSYRSVILCSVHSFLLVIVSYFWMNLSWELPDERLITKINQTIQFILLEDQQQVQNLNDRFLFINCSYDKSLTTYEDEHGYGQIAITDRTKITRLLSIFNGTKQKPKLIVIDLLLQDASSDQDALMLKEMAKSNHLILGWDSNKGGFGLPSSVKKAEAYYWSSSGSFLKYPVLNESSEYLPTAIYTSLHTKEVPWLNMFGFVKIGDRTWLNSFIVDIEMRESHLKYFNLGELIDGFTKEEIENTAKDKIVIIGEYFLDDQHTTVLRRQPGPLLVANTYLSLEKGQAAITWKGSLLLLMFYFMISWRIVSLSRDKPIPTEKIFTSKFSRFLLKYMTYLVIFSLFSILLYQVLDKHFQILLFAFYFNALEFAVKRYDFLKKPLTKFLPYV